LTLPRWAAELSKDHRCQGATAAIQDGLQSAQCRGDSCPLQAKFNATKAADAKSKVADAIKKAVDASKSDAAKVGDWHN
jgi:hypothetical protein